ncbi:putative signal transduction histidine kinase [Herbaspirillum frisingense GSF30]|uniref:Signal transduction histidine kinase n=1 Tax=Herbaspirillum frisingense GSF30 TaxID=864073 RepID=A0AAI9IHP2_9BURK|nr:PIN-like domain-containing protein [Herbaspirillum frisingense]EOA06431.1 putative signal transduction histidine kinase [Herbaspirillum frisingense GSF30]
MLEVLLRTHRDPDDIDFESIWENGLFIFDSNVLLDLYRLPEPASNDLIGVLRDEHLRQRIWIGFQVIVEFLNNRHEAISDQKNKFNTVRVLLEEASSQYDEVFEKLTVELGKLKLKQRHSLIDPDKFLTSENISEGKAVIDNFLNELAVLESKQSDVNDRDQIKDIVLEIFTEKVGEGFSKKELDEIYKSGERRYENNVPPGYKDKSKHGSYEVGDRELVRKFGDLILWKEIIRKVKIDQVATVVLVTGDIKEDWWLEKRGKKLGPRKELLNEIYTEAPCVQTFYMYDTASFLKHAKSRLNANVRDSSISQAKDLIAKSRKSRVVAEEGYVYLSELIKTVAASWPKLRIGIGRSVYSLSPANLDATVMKRCLDEIFSNALTHGIHEYVGVQAKVRADSLVLRFKNKVELKSTSGLDSSGDSESTLHRSLGLSYVHELMSKEGVLVNTVLAGKNFALELHIPKEKFYREQTSDFE